MSYDPFDAMVASARERAEIWRFGLGLGVCFLVYMIGTSVFVAPVLYEPGVDSAEFAGRPGTQFTTMMILFSFTFMALGPMVAARLVHGRGAFSVFGNRARMVGDFWVAVKWMALLIVVSGILNSVFGVLLVTHASDVPEPPVPLVNVAFGAWLVVLPLSLVAILIQTGAEEILFRGYIQQQLAARFSSRWVWMVLPSVVFGLGHMSAEFGDMAWMVVVWATLFGLASADLVARTGGLGASIGLHFLNNAIGILLISQPGPLQGLSLFVHAVPPGDLTPIDVIAQIGSLLCSWLIVRIGLRK